MSIYLTCSEWSWGWSGGEVVLELFLEAFNVGGEDWVVFFLGQGFEEFLVWVGFVEDNAESDGSEGEISNGSLLTNNVLGV